MLGIALLFALHYYMPSLTHSLHPGKDRRSPACTSYLPKISNEWFLIHKCSLAVLQAVSLQLCRHKHRPVQSAMHPYIQAVSGQRCPTIRSITPLDTGGSAVQNQPCEAGEGVVPHCPRNSNHSPVSCCVSTPAPAKQLDWKDTRIMWLLNPLPL